MSFLGNLFKKKDHSYYLDQATRYLAAERYADARTEFLEAQSRCPADAADDLQRIADGLTRAGDRLSELNLTEGEHALNAGELQKAHDHFALARELATDPSLRSSAEAGLKRVDQPQAAPAPLKSAPAPAHGGSSCASCSDVGKHKTELVDPETGMHEEDRYFLLVQPLPGDLPARYAAKDEKFIHAYLLIHEGNDAAAFPILQEMQSSSEDDIVIYELALIMYRAGRAHECDKLLNRALAINPTNAAVYLALVHLKADAGRFPEAIGVLGRMMELGLLADQALFLLGEMHEASGNQDAALEAWSRALEIPSVAKPAAERLIPLLAKQGREAEAKYLVKKFMKGCC